MNFGMRLRNGGNVNTTIDTPKYTENDECKDIGSPFSRPCPKCGTILHYRFKKTLNKANRRNAMCRSCAYTDRIIGPMPIHIREKIRNHHLTTPGFGKWMVGKRLTTETRQKISLAGKGRSIPPEIRKRYSTSKIGERNPAKRLEVRLRISETQKQNPRSISPETRLKLSMKSKEAMLKRIEMLGTVLRPNFNPTACQFFDDLNFKNGWNLRHATNGGEVRVLCYYPDAYDADKNIIVEYDEPHHYDVSGNLKRKDVDRMNRLITELHCQFYRYDERTGIMRCFNEVTT